MQKRAFDLLVYRISQLSCNGFVKKMREELYNRPPRKRRVRERILFSRGENLTREFCTKGGDLHSRLLLLANFLMNFGLIQFERKRVFLTTFSLRSRKNSLRPISRINYHSISENDRILFRPGGRGEGCYLKV